MPPSNPNPGQPVSDPHFQTDLRKALAALAEFAAELSSPDFSPGEFVAAEVPSEGTIILGYSDISPKALAFVDAAYQYGWIQPFAWVDWRESDEAEKLLNDRAYLAQASVEELSRLLTAIVRQDRFLDGVLLGEFRNGLMAAVARRAQVLVSELEGG